jgi:hypothetical protein
MKGCRDFKGNHSPVFRRPGSDLLFRVLGRSTIGAGAIYGRVRDGIGYGHSAKATRPAKNREATFLKVANEHISLLRIAFHIVA